MKKIINCLLIVFSFFIITNNNIVNASMTDSQCAECAKKYGNCGTGACFSCKKNGEKCISKLSCTTKKECASEKVELNCSSEGVKQTMSILGTVLDWIQVVIPVIVVIVGIVALAKAVLASDDGLIKKAVSGLIVKVFIAAAVIFLPTIIFAIVNLIDSYDETDAGGFSCIRCIEKPKSPECSVSWKW